MIHVTFYKDQKEGYVGFDCIGHAEYAEAGEDIVCAGVSALVINSINSIANFTEDEFDTGSDEASGLLFLKYKDDVSKEGALLLNSLVLGLQGIQEFYGDDYISLICKEV